MGISSRRRGRAGRIGGWVVAVGMLAPTLAAVGAVSPAQAADPVTPAPRGLDYTTIPIPITTGHGRATAVSDTRRVVGWDMPDAYHQEAFVFDYATKATASLPVDTGMVESAATAIQADGSSIAGWEEKPTGECWTVRWTQQSGAWTVQQIAAAPDVPDPNQVGCRDYPVAIGSDGTVAISTTAGGVVWKDGATIPTTAHLRALSSNGQLAGYTTDSSGHSSPWQSAGGTLSRPPLAGSAEADGIAEDGALVVNGDSGPFQRLPDGTFKALAALPSTTFPEANARAVSDHDEIVGDSVVSSQGGVDLPHAVRWNGDQSATDLNDVITHNAGETLLTARAVDKGGDVAGGMSTNASGGVEVPFLLIAMPPIIFVPGVAGSHLVKKDASGNTVDEWIGCASHQDLALSPSATTDIYADDVLRYASICGVPVPNNDLRAYGPFIDTLKQQGPMVEYEENGDPTRRTTAGCDTNQRDQHPNLFLFAYDWRLSNADNAAKLADFMGCVRDFYTGPVVVVAHSMGGLVSRRYILDHPHDTSHVRDLVTIGTPWLGAPKLINAELTGDFPPLAADTTKQIVPTMPGPGQLLPSAAYYRLAPAAFAEFGWDVNHDGKGETTPQVYTPSQVDNLLDTMYSPYHAAITQQAANFHALTTPEGSQDDWTNDSTGVNYVVMYGKRTINDTIGTTTAEVVPRCVGGLDINVCYDVDEYNTLLTAGDKTVPLASSSRQGENQDLNNKDHETLIPILGSDWGDDTIEHTALTRNPQVQATVLLTDGRTGVSATSSTAPVKAASVRTASVTTASVTTAAADTTVPQWDVRVSGFAGTTAITDPTGANDAVDANGFREQDVVATRVPQGSDTELDVFPATHGAYEVAFSTGSSPVTVEMSLANGDTTQQRAEWRDTVIPAGTAVSVFASPGGAFMYRDTNGDGTPDTYVAPTLNVSGALAADTDPPTLAAGTTVVGGSREYTISAADAGSGVKQVWWSVDGSTYRRYAGPITLDPATAHLTAFADDNAGNRSSAVTFDLSSLAPAPITTATLVPDTAPGAWSTSPLTVHLHAQASDGTTVTSIHYTLDGASTIVAGDTVNVAVSDGKPVLSYFAVASDGSTEATSSMPVLVDATPPAVTVTAPSATAVVGSLAAISGSASDATSGVASTQAGVERNSDGAWWDGSAWQAQPEWLPTTASGPPGSGGWAVTAALPSGTNLTAGAYTIHARSTDAAGNVATAAAVPVTVTAASTIRSLDGPAGTTYATQSTTAGGINAAGQVAGTVVSADSTHGNAAIRWDSDGTPHVVSNTSYTASGNAINDSGAVAGRGYTPVGGIHPTVWRPDGTQLTLAENSSYAPYTPYAISSTGVVAGAAYATWAIWNGSSITTLPFPSGLDAHSGVFATIGGVNSSSVVAATVTYPVSTGAASSTPVAMTATTSAATYMFPTPAGSRVPAAPSGATGIDDAGDVLGWGGAPTAGSTNNPPFWRHPDGSTTWYDLAGAGLSCGTATGVNKAGTIVGWGGQCLWPTWDLYDVTMTRPFVIQGGVAKDLNSLLPAGSGWTLEKALGINDNGQISGIGVHNGVPHGFILTLGAGASADHAPIASDTSASTAPGTPVDIGLHGTDPDGDALTWSVVTGPQHGTLAPLTAATATYSPPAGFAGTDTFTVRATDGSLWSGTATVTVTVAPPVPPPVAVISGPSSTVEGSTAVLDASGSFAPDGAGPLTYSWDLDGNGTFGDATSSTVAVTRPDDAVATVGLQISGPHGSATTTRTVTFLNGAPLVTGPAPATVVPGGTYTDSGSFVDPGTDTWTATVDYGDGTGPQPLALSGTTFSMSHAYANAGWYDLTVSVCDDDGGCGGQIARVSVAAPPSLAVTATGRDVTAVEGSPVTAVVATVTGPVPASLSDLDATIDWGDGSTPSGGVVAASPSGGFTVTGTHTYADEGGYPLTTTVSTGSTSSTAHSTATAADATLFTAGSAGSLTSTNPVRNLTVARFTDANPSAPASDFTATVDWGDGSPLSTGTVVASPAGGFAVTGSHTFAALGPSTVTVRITDRGGSTATATSNLVVYGFSGGGSFAIGPGPASPYFWGSQWAARNPITGGSPPSFKGFENGGPPPSCGTGWASGPGNSTAPPAALPAYMAVIVTSSVTQRSAVISGSTTHVAIVRVKPGYRPDPAYPGTGTIVAFVC